MDRFPSDLHEKIGPDHVACNPFFDLNLGEAGILMQFQFSRILL